jgi:hypothetical protein
MHLEKARGIVSLGDLSAFNPAQEGMMDGRMTTKAVGIEIRPLSEHQKLSYLRCKTVLTNKWYSPILVSVIPLLANIRGIHRYLVIFANITVF